MDILKNILETLNNHGHGKIFDGYGIKYNISEADSRNFAVLNRYALSLYRSKKTYADKNYIDSNGEKHYKFVENKDERFSNFFLNHEDGKIPMGVRVIEKGDINQVQFTIDLEHV